MKTILLIFSVFLLPISMSGQTDINKSDSNPLLKSTNAVKLRLDSIRPRLPGLVSTFFYDSKGNNIKAEEALFKYDTLGNLISIKWSNDITEELVYDSKGRILKMTKYQKVPQDNIWSNVEKQEFIYDTIQNITIVKWYYGFNDIWGPPEFYELYYIGDKLNIFFGGVCEREDCRQVKEEFFYNGGNEIILKVEYWRDSPSDPWVITRKVECKYDLFSNPVEVIYYGSLGNPLDVKLALTSKTEFKYDNSYSLEDLYLPNKFYGLHFPYKYYGIFYHPVFRWEVDFIKHKRTEQIDYTYDTISGHWVKGATYKYYYSDHIITGIEDTPQKELMIYPNPAKDHIIFDINTNGEPSIIELYDNQGRIVLNEEIQQDKRIQVKHLYRGLYIYRLNYQNTIKTGKVILQ